MPKTSKTKITSSSTLKTKPQKTSSTNDSKSWTNFALRGKLFVFTGPSGSGKSTIAEEVLKDFDFFKRIVTCTTRRMREGERADIDYHFFPIERFQDLIKENAFLECAIVYGNYYGSLRSEVEQVIASGKSVLLVVDVKGALTIQKNFPSAFTVFINAPSLAELGVRLRKRGKDSSEAIQKRLEVAKVELKSEKKFDKVIVNDDLDKTVFEVEQIISKEVEK